jgi:hypothetical protein
MVVRFNEFCGKVLSFWCFFARFVGKQAWRKREGGEFGGGVEVVVCKWKDSLTLTWMDMISTRGWKAARYEWRVSNPDLQNPWVKSIYLMFEILIQCMRFSLTEYIESLTWMVDLMISRTKRFMNTVLNLESWFKNHDINYELVLNWKSWSVAWYTWKASSPGFTFYTWKA